MYFHMSLVNGQVYMYMYIHMSHVHVCTVSHVICMHSVTCHMYAQCHMSHVHVHVCTVSVQVTYTGSYKSHTIVVASHIHL